MNKLNLSRNLAARTRGGLFSILILLVSWLAVVTPLRAQNAPTYWFQIDSSAVPGGFQPRYLALDSSNNVYVAAVVKFDSSGNYLTQWGGYGSGNGQFDEPVGIAVDSGNNVYVVDTGNCRVEKFDSSGGYLTQWGSYGIGKKAATASSKSPWALRRTAATTFMSPIIATIMSKNSTATAII
jgi:hypothetical protein